MKDQAEQFGDVNYYVQETRKCQVPLDVMETEDEEKILEWIQDNVDMEAESLGSYSW